MIPQGKKFVAVLKGPGPIRVGSATARLGGDFDPQEFAGGLIPAQVELTSTEDADLAAEALQEWFGASPDEAEASALYDLASVAGYGERYRTVVLIRSADGCSVLYHKSDEFVVWTPEDELEVFTYHLDPYPSEYPATFTVYRSGKGKKRIVIEGLYPATSIALVDEPRKDNPMSLSLKLGDVYLQILHLFSRPIPKPQVEDIEKALALAKDKEDVCMIVPTHPNAPTDPEAFVHRAVKIVLAYAGMNPLAMPMWVVEHGGKMHAFRWLPMPLEMHRICSLNGGKLAIPVVTQNGDPAIAVYEAGIMNMVHIRPFGPETVHE